MNITQIFSEENEKSLIVSHAKITIIYSLLHILSIFYAIQTKDLYIQSILQVACLLATVYWNHPMNTT